MILTVTPNPALDLTWRVDRLTPGATHRADAGALRAGGKGLNVARVAHAQGAPVLALSTAGGRSGIAFAADLAASGVAHRLVQVAAPTRQTVAIVDEELGDTTIVNERGANPTDAEWAALFGEVVDALPSARVLVISGSLPPGAPESFVPLLIGTARDAGVPTIVDTSGPALLRAAEAGASVLKPNAAEVADATGIGDPVGGARALIALGAELVLLSRGADGMLAVTADEVRQARLDAPLAGNPTGAGDAAVAACAVLYAQGVRDVGTVLRRATAWSAAAVPMPLAGDISDDWADLESRLVVASVLREEEP
ncbi:1-phosphofructokinase family hexose kinase [Microbacterium sp. NPDC089696]|uniref:1-phosphofructokinase family hexose kinase n=1 Tax=Microbacterium sp. NPDC089696 TaxID=3364199 RepID=UPI0038160D95